MSQCGSLSTTLHSPTGLVVALPAAAQALRYAELGWLPTKVAWRLDLERD
jgi:hypothetical protein